MDLDLYFRVLWRFRRLVAIGFALAVVLAVFSFAKISSTNGSTKLVYRQAETWQSESVLFITQPGFPWGSTTPQYVPAQASQGVPAIPTADLTRLASLAIIYAQLAPTQRVQRYMKHPPLKPTDLTVETVQAPAFWSPPVLPLISIKALGSSPQSAAALATDQTDALMKYVKSEQRAAETPAAKRVVVEEIQSPAPKLAKLVGKRGKTLPAVVFLAVMIAVIGLAFLLENLRPGIRAVSDADEDSEPSAEQARRSQKNRRSA
jgi:hypothetical protein